MSVPSPIVLCAIPFTHNTSFCDPPQYLKSASVAMRFLLLSFLFVSVFGGKSDDFEFWKSRDFSLFPRLPIAPAWAADEACRDDSRRVVQGLTNHSFWAMQSEYQSAKVC